MRIFLLPFNDVKTKTVRLFSISAMVLLLFSCSFKSTHAQEPVPSPRSRPPVTIRDPIQNPAEVQTPATQVFTSSISGQVRTPNGQPVAGIVIKVRNKNNDREITVTTNDDGRFRISGLIPGPYQVTVIMANGLTVGKREVVLGPSQSANLNFEDVPVGTPSPAGGGGGGGGTGGGTRGGTGGNRSQPRPAADANTFELYPQSFERDIELTDWLQTKKAEHMRLASIIYVSDKTSLFLLEKVKPEIVIDYTVTPISEPLDASNMLMRIKQNSQKTFVGIHRISGNSYVMVFHD